MRKQRSMFQTKEEILRKKDPNDIVISNLYRKELKVLFIKVLTKLNRRIDEHSDDINET